MAVRFKSTKTAVVENIAPSSDTCSQETSAVPVTSAKSASQQEIALEASSARSTGAVTPLSPNARDFMGVEAQQTPCRREIVRSPRRCSAMEVPSECQEAPRTGQNLSKKQTLRSALAESVLCGPVRYGMKAQQSQRKPDQLMTPWRDMLSTPGDEVDTESSPSEENAELNSSHADELHSAKTRGQLPCALTSPSHTGENWGDEAVSENKSNVTIEKLTLGDSQLTKLDTCYSSGSQESKLPESSSVVPLLPGPHHQELSPKPIESSELQLCFSTKLDFKGLSAKSVASSGQAVEPGHEGTTARRGPLLKQCTEERIVEKRAKADGTFNNNAVWPCRSLKTYLRLEG